MLCDGETPVRGRRMETGLPTTTKGDHKYLVVVSALLASVGIFNWQTHANAERFDGFYSEDFTAPRPITPEMQARPIA